MSRIETESSYCCPKASLTSRPERTFPASFLSPRDSDERENRRFAWRLCVSAMLLGGQGNAASTRRFTGRNAAVCTGGDRGRVEPDGKVGEDPMRASIRYGGAMDRLDAASTRGD